MHDKELLGRKIREIRKKHNATQEYFSEAINIDISTLSNIERGLSFPSMTTLLNIIEKFNVSPNYLFDFSHFDEEKNLEDEMIDIIKTQPYDKKQILYRIIKQFAI